MKKKAAAQFVRRLAREDSLLAKTFGVRSSFSTLRGPASAGRRLVGEGGSLITALYALLVALLVCLPSTSRAQLVDSFDPNANDDVRAIAVQADGKILVGGVFTSIGGQTRNRIARLKPDGSLDASFDPNANFAVRAIAVQADGKILVGGDFTSIGGQPRNRIARLTPTGCSVTSTVCGRIIVGTAPTDFTVNLSDPADPATVQATDFTVNGTPADNDIIINGDLSITFHFNTSPVVGGQTPCIFRPVLLTAAKGRCRNLRAHCFTGCPGYSASKDASDSHPRPTPP